jgi:tripartite-type tricarboxylate transporter receptor subunit TctC
MMKKLLIAVFLAILSTLIGLCPFCSVLFAKDEFPTAPITLLLGYPPGGNTDVQARALAELAKKHLGQPVLINNMAGMGGSLMMDYLARQKPDGYSIAFMAASTVVINPFIEKVNYSYMDFTYIHAFGLQLHNLAVRSDSPWKTFNQLIDYAKKNPGKIKYATYSPISTTSLVLRIIAKQKQIDWIHVPYKGDGPAITAVLGGHTDALSVSSSVLPYVKSGDLRVLAVFLKDRSSELPDVPTLKELGFNLPPLSNWSTYTGIVGPKGLTGTPLAKLEAAFSKSSQDPSFLKVMQKFACPVLNVPSKEYEKEIAEAYQELKGIIPPLIKEIQEK